MRDLLLPDVRSFDELFEIVERDIKKQPPPHVRRSKPDDRGRQETMKIGAYLDFQSCIDGDLYRDSLYVKPTQKCLDAILEHMLMLDRATTHFNVVIRDDGTALVTCAYGLIAGSVYLAKVDLATVPDTREEDVPAVADSEQS